MKKEIKALWIKALSSGEFPQCKGQLEKDGRYCALGVLAAIAMLEGQCTYNKVEDGGRFDGRRNSLSFNIMKWAEIKDCFFSFNYKGEITNIADLNDNGLSFIEISEILKELEK